ncbi:cytochrome P450 [Microbispora sp. NBRC 16548]|uniref:cytochrome P450 n=1 Tax=Microbispora sp. NBRC 16548 TaxID=3030994 RepID=UPI00161D06E2|nr:cytochrome P450 [Microbispora sp. NBRC 16548]GLX06629.1 cytochrome P450 [Microbispora sp. NBRC 16548]
MTATSSSAHPPSACPIIHPFDLDEGGVNRPGLYKSDRYHALREAGTGVADVLRANGTTARLITRYQDVRHVLRGPEFSRTAALDVDDVELEGTLLGLDGDEHTAVRRVVRDRFTPQALDRLLDRIETSARVHLEGMIRNGASDLIDDFALPFALDVIGDLFGVPQQERTQLRVWGEAFLSTSLPREEVSAAEQAMAMYLAGLIDQRRQAPTDDLLTQIATEGTHLPFDQLVKLPLALLVGGWETTASSIGTAVLVLLTHPYEEYETAYAYLVANPSAVSGAATELQRMFSTSAADAMPRRVLRDTVLPSGAHLRAGEIVIPSHDAANFDPRVFSDPHTMRFDRPAQPHHLSFGYGAHYCIGRHLGQAEVEVALTLLTTRLPNLRLAVPAEEVPLKAGHAIAGPEHVPVAWD